MQTEGLTGRQSDAKRAKANGKSKGPDMTSGPASEEFLAGDQPTSCEPSKITAKKVIKVIFTACGVKYVMHCITKRLRVACQRHI